MLKHQWHQGPPIFRRGKTCRVIFLLWLTAVFIMPLEVHASSHKPFLNLLGEALSYREGAKYFVDKCSQKSDARLLIGSREHFWSRHEGNRVANIIVQKAQICINEMYPKALRARWITRDEWERGLQHSIGANRKVYSRFRNFLIKNGVASDRVPLGQCILFQRNMVDIAKDEFC
jgi:hypothetical protein